MRRCLVMLVLFSLIFAGCTTIATKPSVCDNIPEMPYGQECSAPDCNARSAK